MCVDCRLAVLIVYLGSLFHNQQVYPCGRGTVWSSYSYAVYAASYQSKNNNIYHLIFIFKILLLKYVLTRWNFTKIWNILSIDAGACGRVSHSTTWESQIDRIYTFLEICQWHVCYGSVIWPSFHWIKKPKSKVMALWDRLVDLISLIYGIIYFTLRTNLFIFWFWQVGLEAL